MKGLNYIDIITIVLYFAIVIGFGIWVMINRNISTVLLLIFEF